MRKFTKDCEMDEFINQMHFFSISEEILHDKSLTVNDVRFCMILGAIMDTDKYPTNKWVANKIGIHVSTISNIISRLIAKKYIYKEEVSGKTYLKIKTR